jgi:hypothetical protein
VSGESKIHRAAERISRQGTADADATRASIAWRRVVYARHLPTFSFIFIVLFLFYLILYLLLAAFSMIFPDRAPETLAGKPET